VITNAVVALAMNPAVDFREANCIRGHRRDAINGKGMGTWPDGSFGVEGP
jgi:hypothetical protein